MATFAFYRSFLSREIKDTSSCPNEWIGGAGLKR
jgi:hypothetical protein